MGDIQQHDTITATFAPRRTDDLSEIAPPVGWRGSFYVGWMIEDGPYAGEWACLPRVSGPGWVPSGDLRDILSVSEAARDGE